MIGFIYGALTGNVCGLLWEVAAFKRYFLKQPKFTSVNCCYVTMNYAFLCWYLRPCLHGMGDPGLVGLVSFVFTLWGTQNKRNLPH